MSSYKGHTLFALILAILLSSNPLAIALTVIGANIPDFDQKKKKNQVYYIIILGVVIFFSLFILNLPYFLGLIIIFLGVTFYFSEHRSFTHSIFGILTLTASVSLMLIWACELIKSVTIIPSDYIMLILISLLSVLFLNKKLLPVFILVLFISTMFLQSFQISYIQIVVYLFLGLFSHSVLDAFSPSGVKLFSPISNKKYHRNFANASLLVLIVLILLFRMSMLFSLFENFIHL